MHKDGEPLDVDDLYWSLKESVGKYELLLLRAMKFDLHVKLPHLVSLWTRNVCLFLEVIAMLLGH